MDATPRDCTDDDRALVASAFSQIAERGWARLSLAEAARAAGVPLAVARLRLPDRCALLMCFGGMADAHALQGAATDGSPRDRLFDVLMRRIDMFQNHRAGVVALLQALPTDPATALMLGVASRRSMAWMLEGVGLSASFPLGLLRVNGLLAVWLWILRAWQRDTTDDLAPTMAALDQALARAESLAHWLAPRAKVPPAEIPAAPLPSEHKGPDNAQ